MVESDLVGRNALVQINATLIAGMLIFLTIGSDTVFNPSIILFLILGFLCLTVSMLMCFASSSKENNYRKEELIIYFHRAEVAFMIGILFSIVSVILILSSRIPITD